MAPKQKGQICPDGRNLRGNHQAACQYNSRQTNGGICEITVNRADTNADTRESANQPGHTLFEQCFWFNFYGLVAAAAELFVAARFGCLSSNSSSRIPASVLEEL